MAEYLHLNVDPKLLDSLAAEYQPQAHKAANDLLEQLRRKAMKAETSEEGNRRIQWQDWLIVISSTLWEMRTSLVYAKLTSNAPCVRANVKVHH